MDKNVEVSLLLDFYGVLLKEKVLSAIDMYYNDDLSLSEIADELGITRQGVRDLIKRAELSLYGYEEKLGLYKKYVNNETALAELKSRLANLSMLAKNSQCNAAVGQEIDRIINLTTQLNI